MIHNKNNPSQYNTIFFMCTRTPCRCYSDAVPLLHSTLKKKKKNHYYYYLNKSVVHQFWINLIPIYPARRNVSSHLNICGHISHRRINPTVERGNDFLFFLQLNNTWKKKAKIRETKKKTKKIKVEETKERSKKRILFEWSRSSGRGRQVSIQWGRRAPDTLHVCPYFLGPL